MIKNRVDIITLGCSKNLVDSEKLIRQLTSSGYIVKHDSEKVEGEIVVINTCGFIGDAKEESVNMILQFADAKKKKHLRKLFVMGCLSERYLSELQKEIPEVDKFYGKFDWNTLINDLGKSYNSSLYLERELTTPDHYAYVKISEGCSRTCSYCAIPIITGKHISRPMEDIILETKKLTKKGVKEIQLIAQDLTFYGLDTSKKNKLPELVERLSDIKELEWIRLHYAYPALFPDDLLRVMRERENVCKYLDIAFQHISDNMLKKMRRNITKKETYDLIDKIRSNVPGIHLRTTLMTGHPGETQNDFEELLQFIEDVRFERLGGFPYSDEDGTYSNLHYNDDIADDIKQERMEKMMRMQEKIANEISCQKVGKTYKVIIDREENEHYIGRTEFDSPEVDTEVLIAKEEILDIGNFYNIEITDTQGFDLFGRIKKTDQIFRTEFAI